MENLTVVYEGGRPLASRMSKTGKFMLLSLEEDPNTLFLVMSSQTFDGAHSKVIVRDFRAMHPEKPFNHHGGGYYTLNVEASPGRNEGECNYRCNLTLSGSSGDYRAFNASLLGPLLEKLWSIFRDELKRESPNYYMDDPCMVVMVSHFCQN